MAEGMDSERRHLNQIVALLDVIRPMINQVGRVTDVVGRFEAEFEKIGRNFHSLRQDMIELRSGFGETRSEMGQFRSDLGQIRSDLTQFRSDMVARLDAISLRLDEIENTGEANATSLRMIASDLVLQHNAILNAVQESSINTMSLKDLEEQVADLKRRLSGM